MRKKEINWEKVKKCSVCGNTSLVPFLKKVRYWENDIDFNFDKCKECDFIFINPRPIKKDIGKFYKVESYWGTDVNKDKKIAVNPEKVYGPIYRLIENRKKKRIFDLGAGTGLLLTKYKKMGWQVDGIEYSKDAVRFARKNNKVNLRTGDFLDLNKINIEYDYVVVNNVLEHLHKPLETLKKIETTLSQDGKLIIAVPNIESLGFKIFGRNWYPLQPPIHLNQFSPKTIAKALDDSGFKVLKIIHKYPEHSVFSLFESYRSLLTGRNKKKNLSNNVSISVPEENARNMNFIKEIAVLGGKIFANITANLGYVLRRGENIIIYAEKK